MACIGQRGDVEQVLSLVQDRATAIARGDVGAYYRLHDPDFRAVCPFARFRALPLPEAAPVIAVRDIETRGVRGSGVVELRAASGPITERRRFIKDAGRWYLYEDAAPCADSSTLNVQRSGFEVAAVPTLNAER